MRCKYYEHDIIYGLCPHGHCGVKGNIPVTDDCETLVEKSMPAKNVFIRIKRKIFPLKGEPANVKSNWD